jgi:hypothetical protein
VSKDYWWCVELAQEEHSSIACGIPEMKQIDLESFRLIAPPDNKRLLSWWGDYFEAVFCMLHLFFLVDPQSKWIFKNENGITRYQASSLVTAVSWKDVVKITVPRSPTSPKLASS